MVIASTKHLYPIIYFFERHMHRDQEIKSFFLKRHICIRVTHGVSKQNIQKIRDFVKKIREKRLKKRQMYEKKRR